MALSSHVPARDSSGAPVMKLTVAVIGAGIVGVSCAEHLRRAGCAVTLIERGTAGGATSSGNAGILAACGVIPVATPGIIGKIPRLVLGPRQPVFVRAAQVPRLLPWALRYLRNASAGRVEKIAAALAPLVTGTVAEHRALAAGSGAEELLRESDYVYLYPGRKDAEGEDWNWRLRARHAITADFLDRNALTKADAALGPRYRLGRRLGGHGYLLDPEEYVRRIADFFCQNGGEFLRAEVARLRPGDAKVTAAWPGGEKKFDRAVVACGIWSQKFAAQLGHKTMMQSERGYHLDFHGASHVPPHPYMLADTKAVLTPMAWGVRAAGLVEFAGLSAKPNPRAFRLLARAVREIYPDFTYDRHVEWMGHRPSTPDSLPFIGALPAHPQVLFAFGHQHLGLTMGPKTGRIIAALVCGGEAPCDLRPYRAGRFD